MRKVEKRSLTISVLAFIGFMLLAAVGNSGTAKPWGETFQAVARGQSTQLGQLYNVSISINEYSTAEDQKALFDGFNSNGMKGLSEALSNMSSRGTLSVGDMPGYDIKYARAFQKPYGRRIRLIIDRSIRFGASGSESRVKGYDLSAIELDIYNEDGKSTGVLLPAVRFKLDKQKQLEIENYVNAWKLTSVLQR